MSQFKFHRLSNLLATTSLVSTMLLSGCLGSPASTGLKQLPVAGMYNGASVIHPFLEQFKSI